MFLLGDKFRKIKTPKLKFIAETSDKSGMHMQRCKWVGINFFFLRLSFSPVLSIYLPILSLHRSLTSADIISIPCVCCQAQNLKNVVLNYQSRQAPTFDRPNSEFVVSDPSAISKRQETNCLVCHRWLLLVLVVDVFALICVFVCCLLAVVVVVTLLRVNCLALVREACLAFSFTQRSRASDLSSVWLHELGC